jgi:aspartate/methionine/tyrosine aminotransferase
VRAETDIAPDAFASRVSRLREAGVLRLDLTEEDPARCGLGWDARELEAVLATQRRGEAQESAVPREAVASYLAGHRVAARPDRIFFAQSRRAARRLALEAACGPDGEALVPAPARPPVDSRGGGLRLLPYELAFGEEWRIDRKSLRRALGPRTRAILVGNPAEPTGAVLDREELAALDELCGVRGLALVGDEAFLDTAAAPSASVGRAARCSAVHVGGLAGVCGLPQLGVEWVAVTGPEELAAPLASRLASGAAAAPAPAVPGLRALPALLARRERYHEALRARLATNRGAIAAASLREAPWALQWGGGSGLAVLQINPTRDVTELCLALLDEGVAIRPGGLEGLPTSGYLVLSLLVRPEVLHAGLERLEAHLRRID